MERIIVHLLPWMTLKGEYVNEQELSLFMSYPES